MKVPSYDIGDELSRHGAYVVYRGIRQGDRTPVLLKTPRRPQPAARDLDGLQREFELLAGLTVDGIPRALDFIRRDDFTCLVFEDRGLSPWRAGRPASDIGALLGVAIRLTAILGELHRRDLIHGAVAPES